MTLSLEDKKAIVAEVAQIAGAAHSAIAAEYLGLSAEEMTLLRAKARGDSVYLRVVKNTLARRAVVGTDFECMQDALVGPLLLAFSQEDPGAAARVIDNFSKDNKHLVVKAVSIGGKLLDASAIERLASMPTKEQAIAILMSVMKAPITKFARTLVEPHAKMVRTVAAIRDQKQAAG